MDEPTPRQTILKALNPQQREAAAHDERPLLVIAGAGTGKTATLVHRVAWMIASGVDPGRILLLTFTRRAAADMARRVDGALRQLDNLAPSSSTAKLQGGRVWGGTFHAIATRLLRTYGKSIGLPPEFSIHGKNLGVRYAQPQPRRP